MKNFLKIFTTIIVLSSLVFSCDYDDSEWEKLTNNSPSGSTYYVQFKDAVKELEVTIDPATGDTVEEVETSIVVAIMGLPLSEDLTVDLSVDASSTMTSSMYNLASTSITIPAGSASASTTITSVSENMPVGEPVVLVVNLSAGELNAPAGTTLSYEFLRPAPCIPVPGVYTINMTDSYGDGWQTTDADAGDGITLEVDGVIIAEIGMCSPYAANSFVCSPGTTDASATVTIPDGSLSATWYFPGDWWGEIGFTILAPDGSVAYSVATGEGVAGELDVLVCLE